MDKMFKNPLQKEKCAKCGKVYDAALSDCPYCGARADDPAYFRPLREMTPMGFSKEVILFALGFIGFQFIAYFVELCVVFIASSSLESAGLSGASFTAGLLAFENSGTYVSWVNDTSYIALFIILIAFVGKDLTRLFKKFKNWKAYLGFPIGIGLILLSTLVNVFVLLIAKQANIIVTTNENQSTIDEMQNISPYLSILILGLVGPFCEELAYRVGLFGLTRRVNIYLAYFVASVVFGLIHIHDFTSVNEWLSFPDYLVAGAVLAVTYEKFGFGASYIAHATNNVFSLVAEMLFIRTLR
jgi:membrane protease YdiL (CAAX protease family)